MKPYLACAVCALCLSLAICCEAANAAPVTPRCEALKSLPVTSPEQRIEITAPGFSVLPPRGELWCYRLMASQGVSFFRIPQFEKGFDGPPSLEIAALHLLGAMAMSLKGLRDFGTKVQTPDELKNVVNVLINEHLFSQISAGVLSAEHRFRLLESNVAINNFFGATCVTFDAIAEERGSAQAPTLVFVLNLPGNVVCRHPSASDTELIWAGFIERYVEGDRPAADMLKKEYQPFVQSLQFISPR
jgi:hypothetical protein